MTTERGRKVRGRIDAPSSSRGVTSANQQWVFMRRSSRGQWTAVLEAAHNTIYHTIPRFRPKEQRRGPFRDLPSHNYNNSGNDSCLGKSASFSFIHTRFLLMSHAVLFPIQNKNTIIFCTIERRNKTLM